MEIAKIDSSKLYLHLEKKKKDLPCHFVPPSTFPMIKSTHEVVATAG